MNQDVNYLCNRLVYGNQLRCGTARVAQQALHLTHPTAVPQHSWLADTLQPHRRVVFLDTDAIDSGASLESNGNANGNGSSTSSGKSLSGTLINTTESGIVVALVAALSVCGCDLGDVGVICPYRSQVRLLHTALNDSSKHHRSSGGSSSSGSSSSSGNSGSQSSAATAAAAGVELNTADKYQGRDKSVIIVSLVRSNTAGQVGELLRDWRRVNVLLSRAKQKLVLIGSAATLSHCAVLSALVAAVRERGWVLQLPQDALVQSERALRQ
jgi:DNA replication ATP-dependent helicase Dna2